MLGSSLYNVQMDAIWTFIEMISQLYYLYEENEYNCDYADNGNVIYQQHYQHFEPDETHWIISETSGVACGSGHFPFYYEPYSLRRYSHEV